VAVVEGMPVLTVDQPDNKFHRWFLLNGPIDVPAGGSSNQYGTAQDGSYPAFALYDPATLPGGQDNPNLGDHWGVDNGSWKLVFGREGFYVLGGAYGSPAADDGSGGETPSTQRTIVRPYAIRQVVAKLTATLTANGNAQATLQQSSTTGSVLTYSDTSITAVMVFDGGFLPPGQALTDGTLVFCEQMLDSDRLLVIQADTCPTAAGG
ncbi:MAG TPA: hypothetical protein VIK18_10660, partial [Pirellulales bacterium]